MNYRKMSNEELQQLMMERCPGQAFEEVAEYNRGLVIAILEITDDEEKNIGGEYHE